MVEADLNEQLIGAGARRNANSDMEIRPEWGRPSDLYGWSGVSRNLLPLIGLYMLAPYIAEHSLIWAWSLAPLTGLLLYRLTIVMHDCGHASLFEAPRVNSHVGRFLGAVTGIDFNRFKQRHWEHHRNYGSPGDPQGFHYFDIASLSPGAFAWHLFKPLSGLNLRFVISESLSAVTFGLFLSQLRGVAEHGVRGEADPAGFVRSHSPETSGKLFLYDLNFNFHEEHHRYPQVPSCHLAALNASGHTHREEKTMWRTIAAMANR